MCGMTSPPLDSTHGRMTSGVACHHRLWAAQTVKQLWAWHAVIALEWKTRSNDIGRACHHRLWTAHTVERRHGRFPCVNLGLPPTIFAVIKFSTPLGRSATAGVALAFQIRHRRLHTTSHVERRGGCRACIDGAIQLWLMSGIGHLLVGWIPISRSDVLTRMPIRWRMKRNLGWSDVGILCWIPNA